MCKVRLSYFITNVYRVTKAMNRDLSNQLETTMPTLRKQVLLPKTRHWIQQERPTEVNQLLIQFLTQVR